MGSTVPFPNPIGVHFAGIRRHREELAARSRQQTFRSTDQSRRCPREISWVRVTGGAEDCGGLDGGVTMNAISVSTTAGQPLEVSLNGRVIGAGRVSPILTIPLQIRQLNAPTSAQLRLVSVQIELYCDGEHVGEGRVAGVTLWQASANSVSLRVPVGHRMLQWVTESVARHRVCRLELRLHGAIAVRSSSAEAWEEQDLQYASGGGSSAIEISRSDWHDHVLDPVRLTDYLYIEVAVPRSSSDGWSATLDHLQQAERAYELGDDSAVFHKLRAGVEALPGYPKSIFATMTDERKRKAADELLRTVGTYLHLGRHVSKEDSPDAGRFPVDHIDAGFALNMIRVLLAYVAMAQPHDR